MFQMPEPKSNLKITVPLGAVVVLGMIAALVLVPKLWPSTLSAKEIKREQVFMPVMTGRPAPPSVKVVEARRESGGPRVSESKPRVFTAPRRIPDGPPTIIVDPPRSFGSAEGPVGPEGPTCTNCVPGPVCVGCIGTDPRFVLPIPSPPPVKEIPKPAVTERIRVGGDVQAAKLVKQLKPAYPPLARQARIQGMVRFTAVIGKDGAIHSLQIISGHPLLAQAAQDAVKQWMYQPTLLNREPVEVVTQIDVNFTLTQ